jgi:hypothetical protein
VPFRENAQVVLDPHASREKRIDALRVLVKEPEPDRLRELLREAAGKPHCADMLPVVVRSFASLGPVAMEDLRPYLAHADPSVVESATKGMIAIDPAAALKVVRPLLRKARSRSGSAMMRALADRCPAESRSIVEELAVSARTKHRMVALVFLRRIPGPAALPMLFEMFRREPNAKVRQLILNVVARRVGTEEVQRVVELRADLLQKAKELDAVIARRGAGVADPSEEIDLDSVSASRELDLAEMRSSPAAPVAVPTPAPVAAPAAPAAAPPRPLASGAVARPAAKPSGAIPAPPADAHLTAFRALWARYGTLAPAAVVVGALLLIVLSVLRDGAAPAGERHVAASAKLGVVGKPVAFTGEVLEVDAARGRVRLRRDGRVEVLVSFENIDVKAFKPGQKLQIEGIIRDIRGDSSMVVLGVTARLAT